VLFSHLFRSGPSHRFSILIVKSLAPGDVYESAWLRRKLEKVLKPAWFPLAHDFGPFWSKFPNMAFFKEPPELCSLRSILITSS